MKLITKKAFVGIVGAFAFATLSAFAPVIPVSAETTDPAAEACANASGGIQGGLNCANPKGAADTTTLFGSNSIFTTIVNVMLFIIGAISVIMLIYGGIRYTLSTGDSSRVTAAKNTIMYAIVGLVVAFLAFAVVNWILGALVPPAATDSTS